MTWLSRNSLSLLLALATMLVLLSMVRPYRGDVDRALCQASYLVVILRDPLVPQANECP